MNRVGSVVFAALPQLTSDKVKILRHSSTVRMRDITAEDVMDSVKSALREFIEISSANVKYLADKWTVVQPLESCPKCLTRLESCVFVSRLSPLRCLH